MKLSDKEKIAIFDTLSGMIPSVAVEFSQEMTDYVTIEFQGVLGNDNNLFYSWLADLGKARYRTNNVEAKTVPYKKQTRAEKRKVKTNGK